MLPKWHILFGVLFAGFIWFFAPEINPVYLGLVFLASFLIDFDHYVTGVKNTGKFSLGKCFYYNVEAREKGRKEKARGIFRKGDFHLFHTIEAHILMGALGLLWSGFFYIFIGMVFHSLLDLMSLLYAGDLYRREYFFFNWIRRSI